MFCELVPTILARKSRSIDILKDMHANVNPLLRTPPIRQALSSWISNTKQVFTPNIFF